MPLKKDKKKIVMIYRVFVKGKLFSNRSLERIDVTVLAFVELYFFINTMNYYSESWRIWIVRFLA